MTRNLAIGALLGFAFTVLALALWGGRSAPTPPPPPPPAPSAVDLVAPRRTASLGAERAVQQHAVPVDVAPLRPERDGGP